MPASGEYGTGKLMAVIPGTEEGTLSVSGCARQACGTGGTTPSLGAVEPAHVLAGNGARVSGTMR